MRRPRAWARSGIMALAAICLCCLSGAAAAQEAVDEGEIQAAFLFNFGKFVEWPPIAFQHGGPFTICVIGDPRLSDALETLARGKNINGKEVKVRRLKSHEAADTCHILFIGRDARKEKGPLLAAVQNLPILTVGEEQGFAEQGGILNLSDEKDRIQLQANPDAARQAGLTISSKLLSLATMAHTKS